MIILTIIVIVGFYVLFNQLSALQQVVLNSSPAATSTPVSGSAPTSTATSTGPTPTQPPQTGGVSVPANILFTVQSSPVLQPQTNVTITIQSVTEAPDGTVTVSMKAYTPNASSYSAVNPADFLQIVDLSGNNETVVSTTGNWNSLPPQGGMTGTAVFKVDPSATSVIIQVGAPSSANYYKFDFTTQSYQQTVLG